MSFVGRSEYDRDVSTWSPEGRLFQIEYAMKAIESGSTTLGIVIKDGVLMAVEKKIISPLVVSETVEKLYEVDSHMACAMSGLAADARLLVDFARNEAQNHWFTYNEKISTESCVNGIADMALDFSDVADSKRKKTMSRPFGVALLIGGIDADGSSQLFVTDPSGTFSKTTAVCIGSAREGATSLLSEQYKEGMTLEEGQTLLLTILRQVMEEKMDKRNVEMVRILKSDKQYYLYSESDVEGIIANLPASTLPSL